MTIAELGVDDPADPDGSSDPVTDVAVFIGDFAPQMTGPANPVPAGYDYDFMGSDAILRKLDVVDGEWVVFDERDSKRIASR